MQLRIVQVQTLKSAFRGKQLCYELVLGAEVWNTIRINGMRSQDGETGPENKQEFVTASKVQQTQCKQWLIWPADAMFVIVAMPWRLAFDKNVANSPI